MTVRISKQVPLTIAEQTIHTAHFQRHLTIKNIHINNVTAGDVTVRVCIQPIGVAFQSSASLLWNFTVPGNDFLEFGEGLILLPEYKLAASAASDDAIVLFMSGLED